MTYIPKQHKLIGFIINTDCVFYEIGPEVVYKNYICALKNKKFQQPLPGIETRLLEHPAHSLVTIVTKTFRLQYSYSDT